MHNGEKKLLKRRLAGAYVSSVVSISLVLLLVGVAALLIVNAGAVSSYFRENMQVSVMMKQNVGENQAEQYSSEISSLPFIKGARVISREQGTEEMKSMLGDDFLSVFDSSPVPVSVAVSLHSEYVVSDSLGMVCSRLAESDLVEEVGCQTSLVDALNENLTRISLILGVFILLLLFISFVLINNTVRLNVYSKRFTIHTMKLVGATKSFIRKPFMKGALLQGFVSALLANMAILGAMYILRRSFAQLFEVFSVNQLLVVMGIVFVAGILICMVSTYFVVGKLISLSKEELYG